MAQCNFDKCYFERLENPVRLLKFSSTKGVLHSFLLSSWRQDEILSLTITPDEVSLIVSEEGYQSRFSSEQYGEGDPVGAAGKYVVYRIDTDARGLYETGILAKITHELSTRMIPIFCLSTYQCNYIFVPEEYDENVKEMGNEVEWITYLKQYS